MKIFVYNRLSWGRVIFIALALVDLGLGNYGIWHNSGLLHGLGIGLCGVIVVLIICGSFSTPKFAELKEIRARVNAWKEENDFRMTRFSIAASGIGLNCNYCEQSDRGQCQLCREETGGKLKNILASGGPKITGFYVGSCDKLEPVQELRDWQKEASLRAFNGLMVE